ncbi:MAG: MFS transporter, partial [Gammaproteobacteria bacterium]|nr:MFS transporter [Gammaproteobacteria bacterium]
VALGNGLMWPSILALISKRAGAQYQGTVQGFVGSSGAIASVIGLSSAGLFYNFLGSIEFLLAGLMIFCVSILMATIKA